LHSIKYIYRNLKLENILIDRDGYIKLSDFIFTSYLNVDDTTYGMIGTPEFLAPEIINNDIYGKCVDYWSLGVLMYFLFIK
jgi:serine/threonine protein kinase